MRASAPQKELEGKVDFAKRRGEVVKRVVLDGRFIYEDSDGYKRRVVGCWKECLDGCVGLRVLDLVCLNEVINDNNNSGLDLDSDMGAKGLTKDLISHISSAELRKIAIRTRSTDVLDTNVMTLNILDGMKEYEVLKEGLTDLEVQSFTGQSNSRSLNLETSFPGLRRLTLSHVSPRSLDALFEMVSVITRPTTTTSTSATGMGTSRLGGRSIRTSLKDLSFSSTYIRLSTIERLLGVHNIGETLLSFKCSLSWVDPSNDLPLAPSAIFALCPLLEILHLFAPCPISIFTSLPSTLIELGILVMKDSRLPVVSNMDEVVNWANDGVMRRNVQRLVVRWYLEDGRKYHDQRVLRRTKLGVQVFFAKAGWSV